MKIGDIRLSEEEYMGIINNKTAVLFQGACRASAIISNAAHEEETALSEYGFHLGMAFQMVDDLLDYTADTQTIGKSVGADLREGKLTLPVIHALKLADPVEQKEMAKIIHNQDFTTDEFQRLKEIIEKYEGLSYARDLAGKHIQKAKEALSVFKPSDTREILNDIADYALVRNR
jgi:octaprenyl-diphosphate synthase